MECCAVTEVLTHHGKLSNNDGNLLYLLAVVGSFKSFPNTANVCMKRVEIRTGYTSQQF